MRLIGLRSKPRKMLLPASVWRLSRGSSAASLMFLCDQTANRRAQAALIAGPDISSVVFPLSLTVQPAQTEDLLSDALKKLWLLISISKFRVRSLCWESLQHRKRINTALNEGIAHCAWSARRPFLYFD